jgi:elongator complex protein 2
MRFQLPFWLLQGRIPKSSSGSVQKILYACSYHLPFFWLILHQFVQSATLSGHEDWIRSLSFKIPDCDDFPLVLASGSQDSTIRLWNIELWKKTPPTALKNQTAGPTDELLDNFEASLGDLVDGEEGGRQVSLKHHILTVKTGATR